jgi:transposase
VEARDEFVANQNEIDTSNTYWLDQTGINCGMTRLYGRGYSNERVNEYVPDVRFERTSIMGAIGLYGIIAPLAYKGTLNGEFFSTYVKECLAPAMKKGDTLMLDNLSSHKVKDALKPLYDKEVKVVFLPPYSHDFNPIEQAWSKIKAYLRKVKARAFDELFSAIGLALDNISLEDISAWIKYCGYRLA